MYGFLTEDDAEAIAALLVLCGWISRDRTRYPGNQRGVWEQVSRFVDAAAERAETLAEFLDDFLPAIGCTALSRGAIRTALGSPSPPAPGEEFVALARCIDQRPDAVLDALRTRRVLVVVLVRARLDELRADTVPDLEAEWLPEEAL